MLRYPSKHNTHKYSNDFFFVRKKNIPFDKIYKHKTPGIEGNMVGKWYEEEKLEKVQSRQN